MLYSPEDRALQEWFIENDAPEPKQVRQLFQTINCYARESTWISPLVLQRESGLNDSKLQLALRQLEIAGALRRLGDARGLIGIQVISNDNPNLIESQADTERRRAHRRRQLSRMIEYAETNSCRRKFILDYFGDTTEPTAPDCCDNHTAKTFESARPAEAEEEWTPLVILEIVRTLPRPVGCDKLALIAKGSQAQDIQKFGYNKLRYYGKLVDYTRAQLDDIIQELLRRGLLKIIGSEYPVVALSAHGAEALRKRIAIDLNLPALPSKEKRAEKRATRQAGGTIERTLELAQKGLSPDQIAQQRSLTVGTIYDHLAQLIGEGTLDLGSIVPLETQEQIRSTLEKSSGKSLTEIKLMLPESISYGEIRCVIAARNVQTNGPTTPKIANDASLAPEDEPLFAALRKWRLDIARKENVAPFVLFHDSVLRAIARARPLMLEDLLAIGKIGERQVNQYGAEVLSICRQHSRAGYAPDKVEEFLSRPHLKPLRGPWLAGFALDFHDKFVGAKKVRTELGELVYRFKYGNEQSVGETIAERLADFIRAHADLADANILLPIPSTQKERAYDPVPLLVRLIANRTRIAINETVLVKTRQTQPQKEMQVLAQKSANVAGAFRVTDANMVRGKRVLLLDDLYDSGATLAEAARVVQGTGAAQVCVLTVTKTIHSD